MLLKKSVRNTGLYEFAFFTREALYGMKGESIEGVFEIAGRVMFR